MEKTIKCLQIDSGKRISDQKEILKEIQHFYAKLFSTQNTEAKGIDLESILKNSQFRQLSDLESAKLEGELKLEELRKDLYEMKNNKSPGVDGFPAESFKVFWEKLKFFVLRALNAAFTTGRMSVTMRTCIINCLLKGNKPREFLNNWRPILLCQCYINWPLLQ